MKKFAAANKVRDAVFWSNFTIIQNHSTLGPQTMKNEGFTPPKIWVITLKMKVWGAHGMIYINDKSMISIDVKLHNLHHSTNQSIHQPRLTPRHPVIPPEVWCSRSVLLGPK